MKKILASLLTAYVLTNGQGPPPGVGNPQGPPPGIPANPQTQQQTTTAPIVTTAAPAQTSAAPVSTSVPVQTTAAPLKTTAAAPVIVTPSPVIPATTTPPPTLNPYCPLNAGQQSGITNQAFNENKVCFFPTDIATDYLGKLRCNNFACCQCAQINCGFDGYPCDTIQFGDSGAVGVQSINVRGAPFMNNNPLNNIFGGSVGAASNGASLECTGKESCRGALIRGEMIRRAQCSGDMGCEGATILLNDPMPEMTFQCNGMASCKGAHIEINVGVSEAANLAPGQACNPQYSGITEIDTIEFNGMESGTNSQWIIRNEGCGTLLIRNFECMNNQACIGLAVSIIGNVAIEKCELLGVAPNNPNIQTLVTACQAGQNFNVNPNFAIPPPVQPAPVNPSLPAPSNPTPLNPNNPLVQNPNPQPSFPHVGGTVLPPVNAGKLYCDSTVPFDPRNCANRIITTPIANNFVLECSKPGTCSGLQLTANAGYDPINAGLVTTRIDSFKFIGAQQGVTIIINNDFGAMGQAVVVNDVRCEGPGTCQDLSIIAGPGVDIWSANIDCNDWSSCVGCTITSGATTVPCMQQLTPQFTQPLPQQPQPQPQQPVVPAVPANPGSFPQQQPVAQWWV